MKGLPAHRDPVREPGPNSAFVNAEPLRESSSAMHNFVLTATTVACPKPTL
jgi:hypothetical protein